MIFVPAPCISGWKFEDGQTVELEAFGTPQRRVPGLHVGAWQGWCGEGLLARGFGAPGRRGFPRDAAAFRAPRAARQGDRRSEAEAGSRAGHREPEGLGAEQRRRMYSLANLGSRSPEATRRRRGFVLRRPFAFLFAARGLRLVSPAMTPCSRPHAASLRFARRRFACVARCSPRSRVRLRPRAPEAAAFGRRRRAARALRAFARGARRSSAARSIPARQPARRGRRGVRVDARSTARTRPRSRPCTSNATACRSRTEW